jgi:hypothetical protein
MCLYDGDLLRIIQEIPFDSITVIFNELCIFIDQIRITFSPLNTLGIICLIKTLPANIWLEHCDYLIGFLLELAQNSKPKIH